MPRSHPEGRDWAVDHIRHSTAPVIVDIGCGEGTYSDLARGWRPDARWIGVEIHAPYVERFDLTRKYDEVVITDARRYTFPRDPFLLIAGDVIEHLTRPDALAFLTRARRHAEAILISVPIVDYPQHEHEGNPHEAHLDQWDFDGMADNLPGCDTWRGDIVGRYWWRP